jgi:hypothetical protein
VTTVPGTQVDTAIEEAAKRGKTNIALSAIESERKAHASWPPSKLSAPPWPPKAAALRPRWHLSGTWPNSSAPTHTARLLILMMVLCRDPLALTAAASARGATPDEINHALTSAYRAAASSCRGARLTMNPAGRR